MATTSAAPTSIFKKNQKVHKLLTGAGVTTREKAVVLKVDKRGVWLNNGAGNDPSGPFDPKTGAYRDTLIGGFSQRIEA